MVKPLRREDGKSYPPKNGVTYKDGVDRKDLRTAGNCRGCFNYGPLTYPCKHGCQENDEVLVSWTAEQEANNEQGTTGVEDGATDDPIIYRQMFTPGGHELDARFVALWLGGGKEKALEVAPGLLPSRTISVRRCKFQFQRTCPHWRQLEKTARDFYDRLDLENVGEDVHFDSESVYGGWTMGDLLDDEE